MASKNKSASKMKAGGSHNDETNSPEDGGLSPASVRILESRAFRNALTSSNPSHWRAEAIISLVVWRNSLQDIWPVSKDSKGAQDMVFKAILHALALREPDQGQQVFLRTECQPEDLKNIYDFLLNSPSNAILAVCSLATATDESPCFTTLCSAIESLKKTAHVNKMRGARRRMGIWSIDYPDELWMSLRRGLRAALIWQDRRNHVSTFANQGFWKLWVDEINTSGKQIRLGRGQGGGSPGTLPKFKSPQDRYNA